MTGRGTAGERIPARLGVHKLACALAVYAFPVSGFPFLDKGFQRGTGNWKRETQRRQQAAALQGALPALHATVTLVSNAGGFSRCFFTRHASAARITAEAYCCGNPFGS